MVFINSTAWWDATELTNLFFKGVFWGLFYTYLHFKGFLFCEEKANSDFSILKLVRWTFSHYDQSISILSFFPFTSAYVYISTYTPLGQGRTGNQLVAAARSEISEHEKAASLFATLIYFMTPLVFLHAAVQTFLRNCCSLIGIPYKSLLHCLLLLEL